MFEIILVYVSVFFFINILFQLIIGESVNNYFVYRFFKDKDCILLIIIFLVFCVGFGKQLVLSSRCRVVLADCLYEVLGSDIVLSKFEIVFVFIKFIVQEGIQIFIKVMIMN